VAMAAMAYGSGGAAHRFAMQGLNYVVGTFIDFLRWHRKAAVLPHVLAGCLWSAVGAAAGARLQVHLAGLGRRLRGHRYFTFTVASDGRCFAPRLGWLRARRWGLLQGLVYRFIWQGLDGDLGAIVIGFYSGAHSCFAPRVGWLLVGFAPRVGWQCGGAPWPWRVWSWFICMGGELEGCFAPRVGWPSLARQRGRIVGLWACSSWWCSAMGSCWGSSNSRTSTSSPMSSVAPLKGGGRWGLVVLWALVPLTRVAVQETRAAWSVGHVDVSLGEFVQNAWLTERLALVSMDSRTMARHLHWWRDHSHFSMKRGHIGCASC
jgi:hypothetical protein